MSISEDGEDPAYGPATPSAYHSLFTHWFTSMVAEPQIIYGEPISPETPTAKVLLEQPEGADAAVSMQQGPSAITFTANLTTANLVAFSAQHNSTAGL